MSDWVRPLAAGWVVRGEVPGPDVDEFAEPDRVRAALARTTRRGTLLAVQHPHRTPTALAAGLDMASALPDARATLNSLLRQDYRPVTDVVAPYWVDGPDGSAYGVLCLVDPAAADPDGLLRVRSSEEVYPDVARERADALTGLGVATSAALMVPVAGADELTTAVRAGITAAGDPVVFTVDSMGRRHRMWLLGQTPERDDLLDAVRSHPLLVADGNHRVAAATAAGLSGMLALVSTGPDLRIGSFHRVLIGTGLDAAALAAAWRRVGLHVEDLGGDLAAATPPLTPGTVVVRCASRVLRVLLPPPDPGADTPRIDHAVVEGLLLDTALGLDAEGPHVRPLPAGRELPADADAVLLLAPVPLADVRAVHSAGLRMPRKSTYFTPKPRSGLLLAAL